MANTLLKVIGLKVAYGGIQAVKGVSFEVRRGELVSLIGANGAGKTTFVNMITGYLKPDSGRISLEGRDITPLDPRAIVQLGVARSFQIPQLFGELSVLDNIRLGGFLRKDAIEADVNALLDRFPQLRSRAEQRAGLLSGGEQQMLAMGRGLMAHPTLLLLDEPSMGLSPILVEQIFDIIQDINEQGTSILLVEQNALMALAIANRGYVLQTGEIVLHDTAQNLKQNPMVQKSYLGVE